MNIPNNISAMQRRILDFIDNYQSRNGYSPSVREIADAVGLRSTATVQGHLTRLQQKGFIKKEPSMSRTIEIVRKNETVSICRSVPVLGKIAAGPPLLDEENDVYIDIPESVLRNGSEYFVLVVHGTSMIECGIMDQDMVLIRRQQEVRNGEIAAVSIDHEVTLKRFYREHTVIRLQPENSKMKPIILRNQNIAILGKAVMVIRNIK